MTKPQTETGTSQPRELPLLTRMVLAACTAGDVHLACTFPTCSCKILPKQMDAAFRVVQKHYRGER